MAATSPARRRRNSAGHGWSAQGEPVATLWRPILDAGWRCRFAHRSFSWDSEAEGKAAVHVSIVGFDRSKSSPKTVLWTYPEGGKGRGAGVTVWSSRCHPIPPACRACDEFLASWRHEAISRPKPKPQR